MPKITFLKTGQTFEVAEGTSFLEFCQNNDVPQDFGCTVGSCGACICAVPEGQENLNPATGDELETVEMCTDTAGARLGCQLKIKGDVTIAPAD
jgi:ferredoxin